MTKIKEKDIINGLATRLAMIIKDKYKGYNLELLKVEVKNYMTYLENSQFKNEGYRHGYFNYLKNIFPFSPSVLFEAVGRDINTINQLINFKNNDV